MPRLKAGIALLEPIMNVVVDAPEQYQGDAGRRRQPPPRRDPELQPRQGPLPDLTPTSRWRSCSATRATCATSRAARRRSPWSRATTPPVKEELADLRAAS